ncbi:hypothetical protein C5167_004606 [Papaver somniferum]|uniref:Uncharacterized protein n=1 Tax=Papaver somniferum TaxID=3469 RepID=A0A4Y7JBK1_PAPSO|nr:hypothetical protein C5167_004606 [Papaver somniferum]
MDLDTPEFFNCPVKKTKFFTNSDPYTNNLTHVQIFKIVLARELQGRSYIGRKTNSKLIDPSLVSPLQDVRHKSQENKILFQGGEAINCTGSFCIWIFGQRRLVLPD